MQVMTERIFRLPSPIQKCQDYSGNFLKKFRAQLPTRFEREALRNSRRPKSSFPMTLSTKLSGRDRRTIASFDLAFERRILTKQMTHDTFSARKIHQISFKPDQAARWNERFHRNTRPMMIRMCNFAFTICD